MTYRQLLDEAIGQTPPSAVDVDRVIREQRRAAVLRPLAAAAAVVVVATGIVVVLGADERPAPPVEPPTGPALEYFAEYVDGTRVIAETWAPLTERRLELEFVPQTTDGLAILLRCDPAGADAGFDLQLQLGPGIWHMDDFCGERTLRPPPHWPAWAEAGEPSRIELRITGGRSRDTPPPGGTFGLAVAEPVPFLEYPLPPRPAVLPSLDTSLTGPPAEELAGASGDPQVLRADPADPARPRTVTVVWQEVLLVGARAQTPGELRVLLDGEPVQPQNGPLAIFDYRQDEVWRSLVTDHEPGQEVTLTVVPEHMTGDWITVLSPLSSPAD